MNEPTRLAQHADETDAGCIDIGMIDRQIGIGPSLQPPGKIAMAILKNGQARKERSGISIALENGFSFATKAR